MTYRKGQQIECPHCGQDSLVKIETEMDGWTKAGEFYACALCSHKLADIVAGEPKVDLEAKAKSLEKFADFLGTKPSEKDEVVEDDGERRFCRDCRHFLLHPFLTRCVRFDKDVAPMGDCPDFETREEEQPGEDTPDGA